MAKIGVCGLVVFCGLCAAQDAPPELLQYVRDATKLGLKDGQIQQNAVQAGWPSNMVVQALKSVHGSGEGSGPTATVGSKTPSAPETTPKAPAGKPADAAKPEGAAATPAVSVAKVKPAARAQEGPVDHGVPDEYEVGAGDVLEVSVWKEPDASVKNVVVRPDGKITMPLLKEIDVVGKTPTQLEKLIADRLSELIPDADVTVVVLGTHSKRIYVIGGVKKEGPIAYTYRMTIMQALSEAGGLSDYAKRKKIYVLRSENGKEYRLPFDYDAALKGERMELNIPLKPGDTLVIPR
jgi:polysaccharide export outer membrane protein